MRKRPNTWSRKKDIFIAEGVYDLEVIHKYIKKCIKGTSADVKQIKIREGLLNEGYHGICIFENKEIWLNKTDDDITLFVTLLHEIFHYYFRDSHDERKRQPENDFVEYRAEKSATNMLKWYIDNLNKFAEIKELVLKLEVKDLSKEEKDNI